MATASQFGEVDPAVFLDPNVTTIVAGSDRSRYAVHKALLCQKSGYFATAYNTSMKESSEDEFTISDVPDHAFRTLISWLYTGRVFLNPGQKSTLAGALAPSDTCDEAGVTKGTSEENAGPEYDNLGSDGDDSNIDGDYDDSDREDSDGSDDEMDHESDCEDEESRANEAAHASFDPQSEAFKISGIFRGFSKAFELDTYQLSCLVRLYEGSEAHHSFVNKCKRMLKNKLEKTVVDTVVLPPNIGQQEEIEIYDRLVDIYILADRFDIQDLRINIMNIFQKHQAEQEHHLTDCTSPNLATISKACENLPSTSDLRLWLVHRMAFECPTEATELHALPKDFLVDVLATIAQNVKCLWTKGDLPKYQDQCLCHAHQSLDEVKRRMVNGAGDEGEKDDED
ncbi:hypothetical protein AC579_3378 [Pseudocercospora musae]|uniref:BTB domain-containing protein n=1 Tax=Pseudocercospora musae TaxID=113226 RepID=A0A139IL66_9PEZI|nr:hypothetical protein AC579_3378 [Pseudocercospora musae]